MSDDIKSSILLQVKGYVKKFGLSIALTISLALIGTGGWMLTKYVDWKIKATEDGVEYHLDDLQKEIYSLEKSGAALAAVLEDMATPTSDGQAKSRKDCTGITVSGPDGQFVCMEQSLPQADPER